MKGQKKGTPLSQTKAAIYARERRAKLREQREAQKQAWVSEQREKEAQREYWQSNPNKWVEHCQEKHICWLCGQPMASSDMDEVHRLCLFERQKESMEKSKTGPTKEKIDVMLDRHWA